MKIKAPFRVRRPWWTLWLGPMRVESYRLWFIEDQGGFVDSWVWGYW